MIEDSSAFADQDWWADHFSYLSPVLVQNFHPILTSMRTTCPVAYSDQLGGFWVVTSYDDVLRVVQDWETFSSNLGVEIPAKASTPLAIPEIIDPPLHRTYKRLINAFFTPAAVAPYEDAIRALVTRLIDEIIEIGECDFMDAVRPSITGPSLL